MHFKIRIGFTEEQIEAFYRKYRFSAEDEDLFYETAVNICNISEPEGELFSLQVEDCECICGAVTLGKKVDSLQQLMQESGQFLVHYMGECVASEVLRGSYKQICRLAEREYGHSFSEVLFPGEQLPLLPWQDRILENVSPELIRQNDSSCLEPRISVTFVLRQGESGYHGICADCTRVNCPNREPQKEFKE